MLFRSRSERRYNYTPAATNSPRRRPTDPQDRYVFAPNVDPASPTALLGPQYHVEPFTMPDLERPQDDSRFSTQFNRAPSTTAMTDTSVGQGPRSESGSQPESSSRSRSTAGAGQQVIVVHHDGGRVPFSIYSPTGAVVEELPPGYPGVSRRNTQTTSPGPSDETVELSYDRRRQAMPLPRKGDASTVYYTN